MNLVDRVFDFIDREGHKLVDRLGKVFSRSSYLTISGAIILLFGLGVFIYALLRGAKSGAKTTWRK